MIRAPFVQSLSQEAPPLTTLDQFTDSQGNSFQRFDGYRDRIVPAWRSMFAPLDNPPLVTQSQIARAREEVAAMEGFLQIHKVSIANKDVLEIGCHGGAHTYAMVESGAKHVDAIDIPAYGIRQSPGKRVTPQALKEQSQWLRQLRELTASQYESSKRSGQSINNRVVFFDLDIAELERENAYDIIVSWYTLEHVIEPEKALVNMYRALRPGGICFHNYNPFFCANGAHSLCTLDFPYGHIRLSSADFERYVQTYRPQELEVARNFYHQSLNRMTLADLHCHCSMAGFETLALIEWTERNDMQAINQTILSQCKRLYPNVTVNDLLCRTIWVLLQKPLGAGA